MKHLVSKILLATTLLTPVVTAQRASACGVFTAPVGGAVIAGGIILIVSGVTGAASLVGGTVGGIVGGTVGGVGGLVLGTCVFSPIQGLFSGITGGATFGAYMGGAVVGLGSIVCGILLLPDENGNNDFQFTKITDLELAAKLGLTNDEVDAFNSNIAELNALKNNVKSQLTELEKIRPVNTLDAREAWLSVRDDIESLGVSFTTLAKILATKA